MINLIDKLRYLILKIALPKQQFYIQNNGFHSVFHPIIKPIMSGAQGIDDEGYENNNE